MYCLIEHLKEEDLSSATQDEGLYFIFQSFIMSVLVVLTAHQSFCNNSGSPGITRSFIPYSPINPRQALANAERQDFNALQNEVNEAMLRAKDQTQMRNIQNFTDDYWMGVARNQVTKRMIDFFEISGPKCILRNTLD